MKKALSLILVLMLSLAFVAMAETVSPADPIPGAFPITVEGEEGLMVYVDESEAAMADAEAQLAKLSELGAAEYFGADVGDKSLVALFPIGVDNFDTSMGDVTVIFQVPAAEALEAGTEVSVAVGLVESVDENGVNVYAWEIFDGVVTEEGAVKVTIDPETMAVADEQGAMVAICG